MLDVESQARILLRPLHITKMKKIGLPRSAGLSIAGDRQASWKDSTVRSLSPPAPSDRRSKPHSRFILKLPPPNWAVHPWSTRRRGAPAYHLIPHHRAGTPHAQPSTLSPSPIAIDRNKATPYIIQTSSGEQCDRPSRPLPSPPSHHVAVASHVFAFSRRTRGERGRTAR